MKSLGSPITKLRIAMRNAEKWAGLGWLGGTQGHRQCHHSIARIRLPMRLSCTVFFRDAVDRRDRQTVLQITK